MRVVCSLGALAGNHLGTIRVRRLFESLSHAECPHSRT